MQYINKPLNTREAYYAERREQRKLARQRERERKANERRWFFDDRAMARPTQ